METKDKLLYVNINKEILNLCPDLRPEQVITLAEIIFNEFNYEVINNELERHIVGYLDVALYHLNNQLYVSLIHY